LRHLRAVRAQPQEILDARAGYLAPAEEMPAAEHGVLAAQPHHALHERQELALLRAEIPVKPADLVVLAVGVVVAALGAPDLVAAEQHRYALRQQQRGDEIALLLGAQAPDLGVVRRPLDAAVPAE